MKKIFLLTLALLSPLAQAEPERIRLQVEYLENGKLILRPTFTVLSGHSAEIQEGDVFLKATPTFLPGKPQRQIEVKLEIRKDLASGKPAVFTPHLIALEDRGASMETAEKDENGKQLSAYAVNVIANLD